MKKIGVIEQNCIVYITEQKNICVRFETENHSISIKNIKWFDENSEETLNFVADLIIDDKLVGRCSNSGRGGFADYYITNGNYEWARNIEKEVSLIPNYCFPSLKTSFRDILDKLANFNVIFIENKVKTIRKATYIITELQRRADKYRTNSLKNLTTK